MWHLYNDAILRFSSACVQDFLDHVTCAREKHVEAAALLQECCGVHIAKPDRDQMMIAALIIPEPCLLQESRFYFPNDMQWKVPPQVTDMALSASCMDYCMEDYLRHCDAPVPAHAQKAAFREKERLVCSAYLGGTFIALKKEFDHTAHIRQARDWVEAAGFAAETLSSLPSPDRKLQAAARLDGSIISSFNALAADLDLSIRLEIPEQTGFVRVTSAVKMAV